MLIYSVIRNYSAKGKVPNNHHTELKEGVEVEETFARQSTNS